MHESFSINNVHSSSLKIIIVIDSNIYDVFHFGSSNTLQHRLLSNDATTNLFQSHVHLISVLMCIMQGRCRDSWLNPVHTYVSRHLGVWGNISFARVNDFLMLAHCLAPASCLYLSGDDKDGWSHADALHSKRFNPPLHPPHPETTLREAAQNPTF